MITANELALKCKVSRGTVDRALKGRKGINIQTRDRILKAAEKYGYRPNFIGQALSSGKTMTIGILLFDFKHSFFAELYSAFEQEARRFDYVTFPMLTYQNTANEKESINCLMSRNIDAIIILPVNYGHDFESLLKSLKIPVLCIGNRLSENFPFVGIDDFEACFDAVTHLTKSEYRNIYYYCPPIINKNNNNNYAQEKRLAGYKDGILKNNISGDVVTDCNILINKLKSSKTDSAVLCSNDFYALNLQILLRDNYPDLYKKVKIMGFDGLDELRFSNPFIDSVDYPKNEIAIKAFAQIYKMISGKKGESVIIDHKIIQKSIGAN